MIGVIDYMTIDGYEKLLVEPRDNGRLKTVDLHIPNVEFRMMPQTDDDKALILHLLVVPSESDHVDRIKRIIDQPEGNLYSSSVYKQLVPYIRKAKKRRQTTLITHNLNLVVTADAEQIVIATAERPATQPYERLQGILSLGLSRCRFSS